MKGPNYRMIFLTLPMLICSKTLNAQGPPELDVPIDQNLHYLLFVGLAFGLYWAFRQIKSHRSRD